MQVWRGILIALACPTSRISTQIDLSIWGFIPGLFNIGLLAETQGYAWLYTCISAHLLKSASHLVPHGLLNQTFHWVGLELASTANIYPMIQGDWRFIDLPKIVSSKWRLGLFFEFHTRNVNLWLKEREKKIYRKGTINNDLLVSN